jgi:cytoskeleton protein RodZ
MLRAAREQAGFTIERAAMATRISPPFVEALEQSDLAQLPGAVFGRGFIRNLCKAYGVDSTEILAAFDRSINPPAPGKGKEKDKEKEVVSPSARDEKRHQQLKKGVLLIQSNEWKGRIKALTPHHYLRAKPLLLLVAALLVGAIIINQVDIATRDSQSELAQTQVRSETPAVPAANANEAAVTSAPAAETAAAVSTPVAPVAPAAETAAAPAPAAAAAGEEEETLEGGTLVELNVKSPVVVKIARDSGKEIRGELTPNNYRYRFKEQLKFYVEDASAVEIFFKGQRVPTSTVKGEPKRITFQSAESALAKKAAPGTSLR